MKKYFKILFLTLLAVGLMSNSAFAVVASFDGGNSTIASELITPAVPFTLTGTSGNNAYQPAGAVAVSKQISVTLTGGSFNAIAGGLRMCDAATGTLVGISPAVPALATSAVVTTSTTLSLGTVYNFQPSACVAGIAAPMGASLNVSAGATSGSQLFMTIDNYQSANDPLLYARGLIATVVNQFSAVVISVGTDKINFAAAVPLSQFKVPGSGTATTSVAKVVILSNESLGTKVFTNAAASDTTCFAYTPGVESFSFTATPVTGTMGAGLTSLSANAFVVDAAIAATDTSAGGNAILLTNLAANVCGSHAASGLLATAANQITVTITVNGTTPLTTKDFNLAIGTITAGTIVAGPRVILPATLAWSWGMDATQFYVPFIKSDVSQGKETYIKLQSKSSAVGTNGVSVQVLASDGSIVTFTPNTAAITPGTMYTLTGADLIAKVNAAGKTVNGAAGFAAIVTVNTPGTDVFAYSQIVTVNGEKVTPVQRLNTSTLAGVPTTVSW